MFILPEGSFDLIVVMINGHRGNVLVNVKIAKFYGIWRCSGSIFDYNKGCPWFGSLLVWITGKWAEMWVPFYTFALLSQFVFIGCVSIFFLKNGPSPASFSFIFGLFQTNITIFTTNQCEKCPSSLQCWDSNSRSSGYESPPITTRPGPPPL